MVHKQSIIRFLVKGCYKHTTKKYVLTTRSCVVMIAISPQSISTYSNFRVLISTHEINTVFMIKQVL
jgi:hypothetical protein